MPREGFARDIFKRIQPNYHFFEYAHIQTSPEDILKQNSLIALAKFLLKNLVDILTILATGFIFFYHQVVPYKVETLLSAMLGIFALMAISSWRKVCDLHQGRIKGLIIVSKWDLQLVQ